MNRRRFLRPFGYSIPALFAFPLLDHDDLSIVNGYAELSDKPGIGCNLNEEVAALHPAEPGNMPWMKYEDGSICDW